MGELDERADDRVRPAAPTGLVEEHRVDLHLVERQHPDRRDRRRPAEVVERQADAERAEVLHDRRVELEPAPGPEGTISSVSRSGAIAGLLEEALEPITSSPSSIMR